METNSPSLGGPSASGIERVATVVRRRWWVIAGAVVLCSLAAYVTASFQQKQYEATASLVFNNSQLGQQLAGLQGVSTSDPQRQQETNARLVKLGGTAAATATSLGGGLSASEVDDHIDVSPEPDTNIVNVTATWTSPIRAAAIANTYVEKFLARQNRASGRYFQSALALIQKQLAGLSPEQRSSAAGLALQDRAQSLEILSQIQSSNIQVAQRAQVPTGASSPRKVKSTLLGGFVGLLIGIGLAFLLDRLDRRLLSLEDFEEVWALPVLGRVSDSRAFPEHTVLPGAGLHRLPPVEAESFRLLRAHLRYFNVGQDLRLVLATSASAGDGKTTVAQNLAEASATVGESALIIEVDLRKPTLAERLGLPGTPGVAEILIGAVPIEEAIQRLELDASVDEERRLSLSVITAGSIPPNPAELIESPRMAELLEWARSRFELVVIDTPPVSLIPDAIPLLGAVDGVVVVSRIGKNTRDETQRLRDELNRLGAPVLGVVINGAQDRGTSYEYSAYAYTDTAAAEA